MTTHLKDGQKRDKMITYLVTKPYFDRMKRTVELAPDEGNDALRNMSDLIRTSVDKEIKRRQGE